MVAEGVKHILLKRYNLRPRPTCKKLEHSTVVSYSAPKCKRLRPTLRPHTHDREQRRRGPSIPYLTPDIIFTILVYLPADILYNVVRYVCREWYNIISSPEFIDAHLIKRERGLLIKQYMEYCIHYAETVKNDTLQIVEVGYSSDKREYGMSSCNGLVLMSDKKNRHVVNFVTKEVVTLSPPGGLFKSNVKFLSMGCTRSKKFKLVEFYLNHQLAVVAGILTLGVDRQWRSIFQVNKNMEIENFGNIDFIHSRPIVSPEGILHVIHHELPLVFHLDLETETFYTRSVPKCSKINRTYMGTGRSLCFMDYLGKFSWELWLLKDAETGEWTKLAIIDLGCQEQMLRRNLCPTGFVIVPVGFLKDGEIVVFNVMHENGHELKCYHDTHPSRNCITYNVKKGGIKSFHLDKGFTLQMNKTWMYIPHVKSLVSLKFGEN